MSTVITRSAGERSPFRHKPLDKALLDEGEVSRRSGLGGEGVDHGLDQLGLARVDVHVGEGRQAATRRRVAEEKVRRLIVARRLSRCRG
jgi:hypothetical protein